MDTDYAGTLTSDGMALDASRIRASRQHDSDAIPLSDTLITRNGLAHYVRTRSPNVVRYPDGDVSESATIDAYRNRQSTERR